MNYEDAKTRCHVRSGIYREGNPTKIFSQEDLDKMPPGLQELAPKIGEIVPRVFWKNHTVPLDDRVPAADRLDDDWLEYDPREEPACSAYQEMPA